MASFGGAFTAQATVAAPRERVWALLGDVALHRHYMPDVASFGPYGEAWRWVMAPRRVLRWTIQPAYTLTYQLDPPQRITFETVTPHPDDNARARGRVLLRSQGKRTALELALEVTLDLGLPAVAAPLARRVLDAELGKFARAFLANLAAAL
jgi:carbon monoxide dehydrogenase subunit G